MCTLYYQVYIRMRSQSLTKDIILLEVGVDTLRELAFINVCFGYGSNLYSRLVLDLVNKV